VVQAGVASRETTHKAGEARNARIVGSITDADTGRPVPWAWVVLERIPGGSENDTPPGRADSVPARKKRGRSP
jgi:alkylated DNA nucleotide flippase Atl1